MSGIGSQPVTMKVLVGVSGEPRKGFKQRVINPKRTATLETFLEECTLSLKPTFGCARRLCTPVHGTKIKALADLHDGEKYIVCSNRKAVTGVSYEVTPERPKQEPIISRIILPVAHNRRITVSAKFNKTQEGPKHIFVYAQKDDKSKDPKRILISHRDSKDNEKVLDLVTERLRMTNTCEKFYNFPREAGDGPITNVTDLLNKQTYVACSRTEVFHNADSFSPRGNFGKRRNLPRTLAPIGNSNRNNKRKQSRNLSEESSPNNSVNSKGSRVKPRKAKEPKTEKENKEEEEEVIPMKPRKHVKRTPDKPKEETKKEEEEKDKKPAKQESKAKANSKAQPNTKSKPNSKQQPNSKQRDPSPEPKSNTEVDYDKDDGGVFKAKGSADTAGATEVKENEDTTTEVPVDQREAEEIEDEIVEDTHETRSETRNMDSRPVSPKEESKARTPTPVERAPTPKERTPTPKERTPTPKERTPTPKERTPTPKERTPTPKERTPTPKERTPTPKEPTPTPKSESRPASVVEREATQVKEREPTPVKESEDRPESVQEDFTDEHHKAATKIQANYRGYKTRKMYKDAKGDQPEETPRKLSSKTQAKVDSAKRRDKPDDGDVNNSDGAEDVKPDEGDKNESQDENNKEKEEKAAVAIQAGFRGYKVRKEIKSNQNQDQPEITEDVDEVAPETVDDDIEELTLDNNNEKEEGDTKDQA